VLGEESFSNLEKEYLYEKLAPVLNSAFSTYNFNEKFIVLNFAFLCEIAIQELESYLSYNQHVIIIFPEQDSSSAIDFFKLRLKTSLQEVIKSIFTDLPLLSFHLVTTASQATKVAKQFLEYAQVIISKKYCKQKRESEICADDSYFDFILASSALIGFQESYQAIHQKFEKSLRLNEAVDIQVLFKDSVLKTFMLMRNLQSNLRNTNVVILACCSNDFIKDFLKEANFLNRVYFKEQNSRLNCRKNISSEESRHYPERVAVAFLPWDSFVTGSDKEHIYFRRANDSLPYYYSKKSLVPDTIFMPGEFIAAGSYIGKGERAEYFIEKEFFKKIKIELGACIINIIPMGSEFVDFLKNTASDEKLIVLQLFELTKQRWVYHSVSCKLMLSQVLKEAKIEADIFGFSLVSHDKAEFYKMNNDCISNNFVRADSGSNVQALSQMKAFIAFLTRIFEFKK